MTYYSLKIKISISNNAPPSEAMKQRIKEEISIMCSRLERLEGLSNHIHIHDEVIDVEGWDDARG